MPAAEHPSARTRQRLARAALAFVFAWFALGGAAHFLFTQAEMRIVPPWIPWPRAAVLVSGAFELLGAAGLLFRSTRGAALWGLFALTLAVTPANVHMLERAADFPAVPYWALVLRLPFQGFLLWLLWWLARGGRARASGIIAP
ncbi:DoxX family protein [Ramlibacter sp. AN1133]|uniref:DoxX family protein n=1 Tax=Ramlibacter sp. AN1133 TaxID=3133429 RepID=UPI0030C1B9EB